MTPKLHPSIKPLVAALLSSFIIASLRSLLRRSTRLAVLAVSLCSAPHSSFAAESRPNVIVILADDLGWADLSCYGSTFHESPNLDRLAAQEPGRVKALRARLDAWRKETNANMPRPKP